MRDDCRCHGHACRSTAHLPVRTHALDHTRQSKSTPRETPTVQRQLFLRTIVPLSLLVLVVVGAEAGPDDKAFKKGSAVAARLMNKAGAEREKLAAISTLAGDDSKRAVEVLVKWANASHKLHAKKLGPKADKAKKSYDELLAKTLKTRGRSQPMWPEPIQKRVAKKKAASEEAAVLVRTEVAVTKAIAGAIAKVTDGEAVAWIASTGLPGMLRNDGPRVVPGACASLILSNLTADAPSSLLQAVQHEITPRARIQVLDWIAGEAMPGAAGKLGPCLHSKSTMVRRAAVRTMKTLDDLACVPLLIRGLGKADGLLAAEMADLLHHFTGLSLGTDARPWNAWWDTDGKEWLAAEGKTRHGSLPSKGKAGFYGVHTPSHRIVFVLDRSGSMIATAKHAMAGKAGGTEEKDGGSKATGTMLRLAKRELRRSINRLDARVHFNVVFYNSDVQAWREPPNLVPATDKNKVDAQSWFMPLKPEGSTSLFAALDKALEYANRYGSDARYGKPGADTIFLLSDGTPTKKLTGPRALVESPPPLSDEEIERAFNRFMEANSLVRCVVHTIGLGPAHNRDLMRRLAKSTGGTYVAVGMNK